MGRLQNLDINTASWDYIHCKQQITLAVLTALLDILTTPAEVSPAIILSQCLTHTSLIGCSDKEV